jgi:enterochelin esterase-like enzyme
MMLWRHKYKGNFFAILNSLPYSFQLANILQAKNINHWLDIRQGEKHDWTCWNVAIKDYLTFSLV